MPTCAPRFRRFYSQAPLLLLAISTGAVAAGAAASQEAQQNLLINPGAELDAIASQDLARGEIGEATIVRSRLVDIDFGLLGGSSAPIGDPLEWQPGSIITLNLFFDETLIALLERVERNADRGYTWIGSVASVENSSVTLVIRDGVLLGNVRLPTADYQIRYEGGSTHVVFQIDQVGFPPDAPTILDDPPLVAIDPATASDDGSTIDVMVVYTPAARAAEGGTTAIKNLIDLAFAETNTAYLNSVIAPRVNLVHTAEVVYIETTMIQALTDLQGISDGKMDDVHPLRNTFGADVVQLFTHGTGDFCGIAFAIGAAEKTAFAISDRTCATGNYTFGHELGHLQAARHDRFSDPTANSPFSFNHGHVNIGATAAQDWRTIMATSNLCALFGNLGCPRLQAFSNPNVNWTGPGPGPIGVAGGEPSGADNAKTINMTALTVANFRSSVSTSPPPAPTTVSPSGTIATDTPTYHWNSAAGATSYLLTVVAGSTTVVSAAVSAASACSGSTCSVTPAGFLSNGAYVWNVSGTNAFGTGTASADRAFTVAVPYTVWNSFFAVDTLETPFVGDFNGDGKADIITFTRQNPSAFGDVFVSLSTGAGFGAASKWHDFFAINNSEKVVIGDYDGDGKDDIATWLSGSTLQVYIATSTGSGMVPAVLWLNSIGGDNGDLLFSGDANGDGKDDLILFARSQGKVIVALSTGSSFASPTMWHGFFAVSTFERPRVGDVNGDGKADVITFATDSPTAFGDVFVAVSDGTQFGGGTSAKWHDFFSISPAEAVVIGDKNGDGKDDFFTFLPAPWGQVYTALSLGTSIGPNVLYINGGMEP